jgi:hypothetical protein
MEAIIMSVEYKFENPDDYFLLRVEERIEDSLSDPELRKHYIEILKIDQDSLKHVSMAGRVRFAANLIDKIDYLIKLEEGE